MMDKTDDELVLLFKQGSNEAFEQLVLRYKNSLYQYILSMVQDEGAAGDLFQEAFLAFFRHAADYKAQGKFKSWLFLTARNKVFNYLRDEKKMTSLDQTDEEGNAFLHDTLPDGAPSMLDALSAQETQAIIQQAAEQLSPRQREVIYLRQYLSFKEMAELLDRPLGTVLADCHRGIQKMQKIVTAQLNAQGECI
ncbi:MAG: sigma-70 family RNA polymerase sigma factor [Elusimicrobiaceae bacterium]|nr:sigma-70 family RNA polymerase sigma factor [Elusimicrobiaceae bacterium]